MSAFNSTLISTQKSSDAHHDEFRDLEAINKTLSKKCQTKRIEHKTEDNMLKLIGLESKNRYIDFLSDDSKSKSLYNIYKIGFEDKDIIVDEGVKTAINNIANPKLVVDFAYKSLANIIAARDIKNTEYIFNLPVDSDPASKIVPGSKTAKLLGLTQSDGATIKFIDSRNGILEVPSANSIFNCSGLGVNDVEESNLKSIYQLFGSYYKLLLAKGKKKTFTVIVDEENKIYTYSDKNFAAKESGIIDITINAFKQFFTTMTAKGLLSANTAATSNPGLFDELSTYIKNIKKGEKNSPQHITAKGAGDALQMISALEYGQDGVAVSHDRLAVWLAYYIGVSTIIYMNRKDIEGQEKNRITIFQLKEMGSPEQQIANMDKEIQNIVNGIRNDANLKEYYASIGVSTIPVLNYANIQEIYDTILKQYQEKIIALLNSEYPLSDTNYDTETINTDYRKLLSLCMLLLPHFKTLVSMSSQREAFIYNPQDTTVSVDNAKIILENTRKAKKQLDSAMYCYMLNKTLSDPDLDIDDYKTMVLVQDAAGRVSRRKPKQMLKPELFNQTRFDIILDALENSNIIKESITHFFGKLEQRLADTSKPIHAVSNQYIQSMKFFMIGITSMTGGRAVSPVQSLPLVGTTSIDGSVLTDSLNNSKDSISSTRKPSPTSKSSSINKKDMQLVQTPLEEPKSEISVGVVTKFGSLYRPNENVLLDDIFVKQVTQLVFTLSSLDKSIIELLDNKFNIKPLIKDAFIEKLLNKLNNLVDIFDSSVDTEPKERVTTNSIKSKQSVVNRGGRKVLKQYGGSDEYPIIVNDVNESVFLFKLQDILQVVTNINKEKQTLASGAAASGAGASPDIYVLDLNDVKAAIDNIIDDTQVPNIAVEIANISSSINSITIESTGVLQSNQDTTTYDSLEIYELKKLIETWRENKTDPRSTRKTTRDIYRLINAIGNDALISYYKYPVQPMLIDRDDRGLILLEEYINRIYREETSRETKIGYSSGRPGAGLKSRYAGGGTTSKKRTRKNKNKKQKNKKRKDTKRKIKGKNIKRKIKGKNKKEEDRRVKRNKM